jgi:hypothetical protein
LSSSSVEVLVDASTWKRCSGDDCSPRFRGSRYTGEAVVLSVVFQQAAVCSVRFIAVAALIQKRIPDHFALKRAIIDARDTTRMFQKKARGKMKYFA